MSVDFKENGNVEFITEMTGELYALLVKHAKNSRLTVDGAVQQILTVALEHDTTSFQRLAEADRLREEAQAKLLEVKGKLAASESNEERLRQQIASYEHRISWFTTCANCATILDSSIKETERAVKAEALLEKYRKRMAGGDERTHEIGLRFLAATEGPWWSDENEWCYRLHGVMARIPASEHIGEQIMNKQIFKAEKQGQPYQEYWPDAGDAAFIENAWADISFLLAELQHAKNKVSFLLKMPKMIALAVHSDCPEPSTEHLSNLCDSEVTSQVALEIGRIMHDELRTMDERWPTDEPTPEPS